MRNWFQLETLIVHISIAITEDSKWSSLKNVVRIQPFQSVADLQATLKKLCMVVIAVWIIRSMAILVLNSPCWVPSPLKRVSQQYRLRVGGAFGLKSGYTSGLVVEVGNRMEFQFKRRCTSLQFTNLASFSGGCSELLFLVCFAAFLHMC